MTKTRHTEAVPAPSSPRLLNLGERKAQGRAARARCPRSALGHLDPPEKDRSVRALLGKDNAGRLPELIPIRYGRMITSPFAFFRGAVAVMMADIGALPHSGVVTQLCGDCHIANFGGFASPEQTILFGVNDFDQTYPGPFEWDVKRLAASFVVAARDRGLSAKDSMAAAITVVQTYRERMIEFAAMRAMDIWYFRIEAEAIVRIAENAKSRQKLRTLLAKAASQTATQRFAKLTRLVKGVPEIREKPPMIYHLRDIRHFETEMRTFVRQYIATLPEERRVLLTRYELVDVVAKVTGVGSVGTRCAIALLMAGSGEGLFLQLKEARPSVLQAYAGTERYRNQGLRVVIGQHLMQSASDIFLGWFRSSELKTDFYVRHYNDTKFSLDSGEFSAQDFVGYARLCGWELARAHAKAGDAAVISGYLGKSAAFDKAIVKFAVAYADRTAQDHQQFVQAAKDGRIEVTIEA